MSVAGIATAAAVNSQSQTQAAIGVALQKQAHQADQAIIAVIQETLENAPPPGQGKKVDVTV